MGATTTVPKADLSKAYGGSYFTIPGAGGDLTEWVEGVTGMLAENQIGKPTEWFQTNGQDVNEFAAQRGSVLDPFPDDLTILMFPLDGLSAGPLAMFKIQMQARWFDDIIDNMVAGV